MQDLQYLAALIAWSAFGLAFVFGAVANRVDFCTMGAVTDVVVSGDWRRMRMWLLAIAVAMWWPFVRRYDRELLSAERSAP